ncbi:cupin domain-containing protein [Microbispora sp. RL4-1S]|uniref:Cupin domain-containing protein n=1 Tax=Microbispora oryzae TaxID=2806554 RepID=A0A941AIR6_9ACTN|nr:cupin domain-containing protein [Microbispora oryzae]MBP2705505.1 cupin domain-containing protein [Microbispora oryzae]
MTETIPSAADVIPAVFAALPGQKIEHRPLSFRPLASDGRVGAEIHELYTTEETGPDGPAAALVRYLPGATAKPHLHPGYETIYVLGGELETDDGVFPAGSVLVMHPGSVHAPRSPRGCLTLVVWEQPVRTI